MSDHFHALVWIDRREARVFQFDATDFDPSRIRSAHPDRHIHHKLSAGENGPAPLDKAFFKRVAQALEESGAILVTGPADTKTELLAYMKSTQPALAARIAGVENLDHPRDSALVALARSFFKTDAGLHSQSRR
jgi:stalled ribosome rescue protein Dom34